MTDFPPYLPYRYVTRAGRTVLCKTCHQALASGDPYVLKKNWGSQRIEIFHYPSCPRQTKTAETIRMSRT
jgi:hypothetical protein